MRGQKRPTAQRAQAVGLAAVVGIPEASRQTGIADSTLRGWFNSPEFVELRERTRDQVSEEWWAGVQRGMRSVIAGFDSDASLRDKAIAVGVLFDKLALMRGDATARTETRTLGELDDSKRAALRDFLSAELQRRRAGDGDPGTGVDAPAASDPAA